MTEPAGGKGTSPAIISVEQRILDIACGNGLTSRKLADLGWKKAMQLDPHLANGLNVHEGHVTNEAVAKDLGYKYKPVADFLK